MATTQVDHFKTDSFFFTFPIGTVGGNMLFEEFDLDTSFDEVVAVEAHEVDDGGVANGYYQLGIGDDEKTYVELAHKNSILTSANVPQSEKGRRVNIPLRKGKKLKARIKWPTGALTSDIAVELVFTLKRKVTVTI